MQVGFFKEVARRILDNDKFDSILTSPAGMLWRTHDYGILEFSSARMNELDFREARRLLGVGQSKQAGFLRKCERAIVPVNLLYYFSKFPEDNSDPEIDSGLPGKGTVIRGARTCFMLSSQPEDCLRELLKLEKSFGEEIINRILASTSLPKADHNSSIPLDIVAENPCGKCSSGLLGGDCDCMGSACVNNQCS
jgi:hypothetical protein